MTLVKDLLRYSTLCAGIFAFFWFTMAQVEGHLKVEDQIMQEIRR